MDCDCSYDDGERCDVYNETFPVARKTHACCECGADIPPHQKYHKYSGHWNNKWNTYKTCLICYKIRQEYCYNGFMFGHLRDVLQDCFDIDYLMIQDE